ncbi:hypothetical protein FH972_021884 [Carpinus fangiana]|uniref:M protein repeat protein n=1 Tax=Carpinus fangiana TaxID=176857 RepID=A0A5N6KR97_9ROSI|nr:hypothetical protein FH972_021884 [Carpinus fangiana]
MVDEDKEKAEKVAAARKRYEELKKQKAKEGDKTGDAKPKKKKKKPAPKDKDGDKNKDDGDDNDDDDDTGTADESATPASSKDDVKDSKNRSESFRDSAAQAAKREALEKDNKRLEKELNDKSTALEQAEEKVEGLQERVTQVDTLKKKVEEIEGLNAEIASLKRENANLQQTNSKRRSSFVKESKTDDSDELKGKIAAVEALELELSKIKHSLAEAETKTIDLEAQLKAARDAERTSNKQAEDLRAQIDEKEPSGPVRENTDAAEARAKDAEARLSLLASDADASKKAAADAGARADALEKKLVTLEKIQKSSTSGTGRAPARKSVDGDGGGVEELEDEERRQLQSRVRELESEVFELRRSVWRDQRANMQGDMDDDGAAARSPGAFSDVDLSQGPYGGKSRRQSSGVGQAFAFQNVINAFTGQPGVTPPGQHKRVQSKGEGLLDEEDDDMEFDEEAFRKAQEEEAKARLERVKEVKRGLSGWKGWKIDLVELRGGEAAGIFDV